MSQAIIGKVRPAYQGEYDETKTYSFMDRVFYNNNVYEAVTEPPVGTLPTDSSYWAILQERGLKGDKGDPGDSGSNGTKGLKGAAGDKGETGDMPSHSWAGTTLYIQNADGELDGGVDLKGPKGVQGLAGDVGPQPELSNDIDSEDKTKVASSYAVKLAYEYALSKEVPISDATDSDSSTTAASSKAVKEALAQALLMKLFLVGSIMPFSGSFGGTDSRYPIPAGSSEPDTSWVICDGVETNGIAVPDFRGRMIKGGSGTNNGEIGGAESHSHSVSATGGTTVSVAQLPKHTHTFSDFGIIKTSGTESSSGWAAFNYTTVTSGPGDYTTGSHSHAASTSSSMHNWPPCYTLSYIIKIA